MSNRQTQLFSTVGLKFNTAEPACNRSRVFLGTLCNYKCDFCYYKFDLKSVKSLEQVKSEIDRLYNHGMHQFDLSGGEPAVFSYFFDVLDYITNTKHCEVSCLSNGFKFADLEFCKKAQSYGLNEILFSLHGSNAELHDSIIGHKGAFKRITKAIENTKLLGFRVRINCTVYDKNCDYLDEYSELLNKIKPFEVNFILMNYFDNNSDYDELNLTDISNKIKHCIDSINNSILINLRYVPYCYFEGYEKYITGYYQLIYDVYDWYVPDYTFGVSNLPEHATSNDRLRLAFDACKHNRVSGFYKPDECRKCKYFFICDGVKYGMEKQNPVKPVSGNKINDILYFRHQYFENC